MSTEEIETQSRQNASPDGNVEHSHVDVATATTPSKKRFDLGPASDYYFKYVNSSVKKAKGNDQSFVSIGKITRDGDESTVNSSAMIGLESLLGDGGEDTETSMISIGANSSGGSSRDLMDKSTLSDTTELTAANFVLAATSRQRLNHVTKTMSDRTMDNIGLPKSDHFKKTGLVEKEGDLLNKENTKIRSESSVAKKIISPLKAQIGATPGQGQVLADHLQQSHEKTRDINSNKEENQLLSPSHISPSKSLEPKSPEPKSTNSVERRKLEASSNSPASTMSEGAPSQSSIADESIASLSAFESLFDDLPTESISSSRRSRRMSSMPSRKSSIARLLDDDDSKLSPEGAPSPKDSGSMDRIVENDNDESENASNAKDSSFTLEPPVISKMKWQEIPSPPPPNKQDGMMFQLTPSSHKKPTPTKLAATPQRVINVGKEVEIPVGGQEHDVLQSSGLEIDSATAVGSPTTGVRKFSSKNLNEESGLSKDSPGAAQTELNQSNHTPSPPAGGKELPSFLLTPNSHVKPTPTKLSKSPRRVLNPKAVDSPARNTRRSKKSGDEANLPIGIMSDLLKMGSASPEQASQEEVSSETRGKSESIENPSVDSTQQGNSENQQQDAIELESGLLSMDEESDPAGDEDVVDDSELHANLSAIRGTSFSKEAKIPTSPDAMSEREAGTSMLRLTPNSHVKPTPTKIQPSPRRVPNPRASPRRVTRSSKKAVATKSDGDTATTGLVQSLLGGVSAGKRKKSDVTGSLDEIRDLLESTETDNYSSQKRRKSAIPQSQNGKLSQDQNDSLVLKTHPLSILSSKKRRPPGVTRRFVAFGSPEAAEYHVGSPSFSLTPMPRGKAKAMFPFPKATNQSPTAELPGTSTDNGETVEMEANLNELVSNMEGSPGLSPIANVNERGTEVLDMDVNNFKFRKTAKNLSDERNDVTGLSTTDPDNEDETIALEPGIDKVLEKAGALHDRDSGTSKNTMDFQEASLATKDSTQSFGSDQSLSSKVADYQATASLPMDTSDSSSMNCSPTEQYTQNQFPYQEGQVTVELELNVNALIQATQLGCSPNESFQFTDGQSIASMSMNSRSGRSPSHSSPLMSAQKLDFQVTESRKLDLSTDIEDGQTVELENDMTGLIAVAAAATAGEYKRLSMSRQGLSPMPVEASLDDVSENASRDETESSMNYPRDVSGLEAEPLDSPQNCHLQSESESDETKLDSNASLEADTKTTENYPTDVAMTVDEFLVLAGISEFDASSLRSPNEVDAIVQILQSASKGKNPFLRDFVARFVLAVCEDIECNTGDDDYSAKVLVNSFLVEILRESRRPSENGEIDRLVQNAKESVQFEWKKWISSVLVSFRETMHKSLAASSVDFSNLNSETHDIGSSCADLITRANTSINHSRERAMARRKAAVASLEQEVQELQSKIEACKSKLHAKQEERKNTDSMVSAILESQELKEESITIRPKAVSIQKEVMSLKGLHSWNASSLKEHELSFCFPGHTPMTSIAMSFGLSNTSKTVELTSRVEPNCFRRNLLSSRKYSASIMSFLDTSAKRLVGSKTLPSPGYIGLTLQQVEFDLGRLDLIAYELENLRRRYQARLCGSKEGQKSLHHVVVDFSRRHQRIRTTFKLLDSYPATPLDFSIEILDGSVDVDAMEETVTKKVKPGYWCMTRACDIVVALLRIESS